MSDNLPALVPGFKPPATPTLDTFSRVLAIRRYESGNIDWNVWIAPDRVIPAPYCNSILAELEAVGVPASKAQAAAAATFLIGAYRATDLNDPRMFTRILAATLQEYPAAVAIKAVDDLTRTSKWLPSRSELIDACEKRMDELRYAEHVVRKHLEEHAARERRREMEKQRLAERAKRYDENPHWRVFDRWAPQFPVYRADPQWEWRLKPLLDEFGEAAVDEMHRELLDLDPIPSHYVAMQRELSRLMQARRGARSDEAQP